MQVNKGFSGNTKNDFVGVAYNDLSLDLNGNIRVNSGREAISTNIVHNLLLLLGEYDFDIGLGIPWDKYLESNSAAGIRIKASITRSVLGVLGVEKINSINLSIRRSDRSLQIEIITTLFGDIKTLITNFNKGI